MLEPDGETCPPHNIVANPDIDMLMSVHEWNTEPQICVIFGAEDVARYQFLCRAPFKIGNRTFLGEGITEEQHISAVNDMAHGQELVCSDEVLKEIFSEAEMVSLYRFSFEIERARNRLDLNVGADDITGDHVVPQHIQPPITEPRLVTANQAERVGQLSHTYEADMYGFPSGAWTINNHPAAGHGGGRGSFIPHEQTHYNTTPLPPQVTRTTYWDNLMSSRYALELQRIYMGFLDLNTQATHTQLLILGAPTLQSALQFSSSATNHLQLLRLGLPRGKNWVDKRAYFL
ncbi:uncharacterized protein LOC106404957 [Brassica napus]|uniref:uncharacterized protein LOC106404957 n=1 Tax=Brassica napus TaxID=3708 RepID=UPI0006AA5F23|nr:uncharacterized protein LOC106404957 [Brassica napus]XP_022559581.1 uncharacterized protein LOC106404957 [Brassica napus]